MTKEELELENSKLKIKVDELNLKHKLLKEELQNKNIISNIYNYIAAILGYTFIDGVSSTLTALEKILVCAFVIFCLTMLITLLKRR